MRRLEDFSDADLRVFARPALPPPAAIRSVYLIGICGKGMGALAELLAEAGYAVRGSDEAAYPPMSTRLAAAGIEVLEGYDAAHLDGPDGPPDLVVVGNAAVPTHPEAAAARERGLVQASLPETLAHLFLAERRPAVVAGTHGKTTTTGMLVHVLREAGLDPGFLVGGVLVGEARTSGLGSGAAFCVEGDEYDAAYFDKRPKMILYRPYRAVVTSLEFDHADIYADWDEYQRAFHAFVSLPPPDGLLVLNGEELEVRALAEWSWARVRLYGEEGAPGGPFDVAARDLATEDGAQRFTLVVGGEAVARVRLPLGGRYNALNALAVAAVALDAGATPQQVADGLASFAGMKRRQEVAYDGRVLVVDDFAHHPTAVEATVRGVRERWPGRRVVAVFEPRSNSSRRAAFESPYARALAAADAVFLSTPPLRHNDDPAHFLDAEAVAASVREGGTPAAAYASADALLPDLLADLRDGDLALVMSNGSFDGLVGKLADALAGRNGGADEG
ncbi:Mur ligase family protein [Rubrivirga sp. S365]|uniref:UDP-N-acetylmuramate--L-alanine ligase n=1 Tax=Rubrivirga sp. S365 TaxID=3076080 RepID=UPI0028C6FEC1|nr:Mur ligase domain-containing protein [Rubrivirga sp. S365]MDT7855050.1 Mur ligase family protein [Rubrivirga sp. S365]